MKKEIFKKGDLLFDKETHNRKVKVISINKDGTLKVYDMNQNKELNGLNPNSWYSIDIFKEEKQNYDFINPDHYKTGGFEVIEMMEVIWGKEYLITHCEMTAFKYRMRAGKKPDQPIERDLDKANWYEKKAMELRQKK